MATKTLQNITLLQPALPVAQAISSPTVTATKTVTPLVASTGNTAYFNVGDTAYYLYNGVQLPVNVRALQVGPNQGDGSNVVYTVTGHIGSLVYPSGYPRYFKSVPSSLLTTR